MIRTIAWTENGVLILDQRRLPLEEVYITCRDHVEVAEAIRSMAVRGAPAIAVAAAMGIALGVRNAEGNGIQDLDASFGRICENMAATRPTAVNLFRAIARMQQRYERERALGVDAVGAALVEEAQALCAEDVAANRRIGRFGQELVPDGARILTHCNAGALATAGYGTALGIVRAAVEAGKTVEVYADETRPFLQGARLTAWELEKDNIPATVITDSMAGHFLRSGRIDCVLVGADRIAGNGDVANKIGTYSVAVLAKENLVPFYVAAPLTTLDLALEDGTGIPIEERDPDEVRKIGNVWLTLPATRAANPAFDVTPHRYVSGIVTDRGIARPPFLESLRRLAADAPSS